MYDDLDYSAFANLNLRHFETESAEQRPPSLLPQTPALIGRQRHKESRYMAGKSNTLSRWSSNTPVEERGFSKPTVVEES